MSLKHLVIIALFVLSCKSNDISRSDIRHAQKLFGIEFSSPQIKTMQSYLARNLQGFDSMRILPLDNNVTPAMIFDPLPMGFSIPTSSETSNFILDSQVELPENLEELAFYPVSDLSILMRENRISSVQLTNIYLNRIKRYDGQLESVITLLEERALQKAEEADEAMAKGVYKGPLHGIPYGVKDLLSVEDAPTTWGAVPYKDQIINQTATVVEKLDEAGAVLIAKLVSGSLARGDVWFDGQTKNPWDIEEGAGGSSAGSGAATAAGLVAFSIGTETLGSITSPSTRCGVTGLRPTYGRVSRHGVMSLSWSMDKVGPICRSGQRLCHCISNYSWEGP